jgi:hypothetical protein
MRDLSREMLNPFILNAAGRKHTIPSGACPLLVWPGLKTRKAGPDMALLFCPYVERMRSRNEADDLLERIHGNESNAGAR